ncbi:MAG: hypothetical protein ABIP94_20215 [Planctomycetota bacterium]
MSAEVLLPLYQPSHIRHRATAEQMRERHAVLRNLVQVAIERHLPEHEFDVLKVAEASERQFLSDWAGRLRGRASQVGGAA